MRISPTILDIIAALRTAIEQDDTSHTTSMAQELARLPDFEGSKATAGYHVSPEGDIKDDYWWLIMDDGSVFDADADEPCRCSKKDPRHGRYFPYTGEVGIPAAVLQAADHLRAKSRTANNKSFSELMGEASGASAPSGVARQAPEALPDAMTMDGKEGIPVDAFDDETKPEDLQMGWQDLVGEDEGEEPVKMGINVNDKVAPWTDLILNGQKTIETRNSNSLGPYVGKRVGLVRTGKGPATLVGYVTIGEPKVYRTAEEFDADYDHHQVDTSMAGFDFRGVKYGYPVTQPERIEPRPINSRGIVSRNIEEVDHPGYMPDGEGSGTDDYDPTYDERSANTNTGWPRP